MQGEAVNLNPPEIWKSVEGWEGFYEVSNQGRVRSLSRTITVSTSRGSTFSRDLTGRILKTEHANNPYSVVGFDYPGQKRETHAVHRLVAHIFIGPCPEGLEVCHYNGNGQDNRVENLRYDTCLSNHKDKYRHGTVITGTKHVGSKLTQEQVDWVRSHANSASQETIGKKFGVTHNTIGKIIRRESYCAG